MSCSKAPYNPARRFFKPILSDNFTNAFKLDIPEKFVKEFGDEVDELATLVVPTGKIATVKVKKSDENNSMCLSKGLGKFLEDHLVEVGDFLFFKYRGHSIFKVQIFSSGGTEYKYHHLPKSDDDDSTMTATPPTHDDGEWLPHKAIIQPPRGPLTTAYRPSHEITLKPYMFRSFNLYFPMKFGRQYLPGPWITLQDVDGNEWPLKRNMEHRKVCVNGFGPFYKAKNLKVDDRCIFEPIGRIGDVDKLVVQVIRAFPSDKGKLLLG